MFKLKKFGTHRAASLNGCSIVVCKTLMKFCLESINYWEINVNLESGDESLSPGLS